MSLSAPSSPKRGSATVKGGGSAQKQTPEAKFSYSSALSPKKPLSEGSASPSRSPMSGKSCSSPRQTEAAYDRVVRLMAEAKAQHPLWKSGPSPQFRSRTARLTPTQKLPTDAMYTLEKEPATSPKSGWGVSKVPQREPPRKLNDALYTPKDPDSIVYVHKGKQSVPSSPRMPPTPNNKVPPVGSYTSPYISCGMGL